MGPSVANRGWRGEGRIETKNAREPFQSGFSFMWGSRPIQRREVLRKVQHWKGTQGGEALKSIKGNAHIHRKKETRTIAAEGTGSLKNVEGGGGG